MRGCLFETSPLFVSIRRVRVFLFAQKAVRSTDDFYFLLKLFFIFVSENDKGQVLCHI